MYIYIYERTLFAVGGVCAKFLPLRAGPSPCGVSWAMVGPPGPLRAGPLWAGLLRAPWALVGPPGLLRAWPLWAGPLRAPLGPYGPGPCGLGFCGPAWALEGWALVGRALMCPPGIHVYVYIYIYIHTKLRPGGGHVAFSIAPD